MDADHQTSFTVEASGRAPATGWWDCPIDMQVAGDPQANRLLGRAQRAPYFL